MPTQQINSMPPQLIVMNIFRMARLNLFGPSGVNLKPRIPIMERMTIASDK